MRAIAHRTGATFLLAALTLPGATLLAQPQEAGNPAIVVTGDPQPDLTGALAGPEIKGVITARNADKIKVTAPDGTQTLIYVNEATRIRSGGGLFGGGGGQLTASSLLNGLPVTVKTLQAGTLLVASQVSFKSKDLRTAMMIRNATDQRFTEQAAATEALRGRMADIDKYNIRGTTNVYFDTGRWALSPNAKAELCNTASTAEATDNALLLVVGYTDSVGSEEYNQTLSEKRASSVINFLQQACRWKPYRMLTPTGMAESDPTADNNTPEGRAQNRRVAVNVLVSKSVDGM
jgi:OmpA-OmpF porin, OOP family